MDVIFEYEPVKHYYSNKTSVTFSKNFSKIFNRQNLSSWDITFQNPNPSLNRHSVFQRLFFKTLFNFVDGKIVHKSGRLIL